MTFIVPIILLYYKRLRKIFNFNFIVRVSRNTTVFVLFLEEKLSCNNLSL